MHTQFNTHCDGHATVAGPHTHLHQLLYVESMITMSVVSCHWEAAASHRAALVKSRVKHWLELLMYAGVIHYRHLPPIATTSTSPLLLFQVLYTPVLAFHDGAPFEPALMLSEKFCGFAEETFFKSLFIPLNCCNIFLSGCWLSHLHNEMTF